MFRERFFANKLEQMVLGGVFNFFIVLVFCLNIELKMSPKMINSAHNLLQSKNIRKSNSKFALML